MLNISDLSQTKSKMGVSDDNPKKKDLKKKINNNYKKYSGVVDENGKAVDNPTQLQAMKTMAKYMIKNQSDQSSSPSNVYRPEFNHTSVLYNKKKVNPNT